MVAVSRIAFEGRFARPHLRSGLHSASSTNVSSTGARVKDFVGSRLCLEGMERTIMELRHLRYFIAVAEEGSFTLAAEKRLHTTQPSLGRQIRALEDEVGTKLMTRSVHGIELTAAGTVFLDHARLAVAQSEAGKEAARRAAQTPKPSLAVGFLSGYLLPDAMRTLRDKLPDVEVKLSSDYSPRLADALMKGDSMQRSCDQNRMKPVWSTNVCARNRSFWSFPGGTVWQRARASACLRSGVSHSSNLRRPPRRFAR